MFFEIYKQGKVVKRGNRTLNETIDFGNEMMTTPEMPLSLPIEYLEYIAGREQFKLYANEKCFWGIIKSVEPNMAEGKVDISVSHHIDEWNNRQISINNAIDDKSLNIVFLPNGYDSNTVIVRNLENNEEMVGQKLTLKYQEFKGKSKREIDEWIADYVKKNDTVIAFNLDNPEKHIAVEFVSSTLKPKKLTTQRESAVIQGTYSAKFKTKKGSEIRIKVTVSYTIKRSGTKNNPEVDGVEPSIQDEIIDILNDANFVYYDWNINFETGVEDTKISYVYSKQSKYEALNKTIELTDDLFWRVGFQDNKDIDIGRFGEHKPYTVSLRPSDTHRYERTEDTEYKKIKSRNIQILEEPTVNYDFENVVNVATVLSEKSDSGASCLTLRDLYNLSRDEKMQMQYPKIWEELKNIMYENGNKDKVKFPIIIIRDANYTNVNNERRYAKDVGGIPLDIYINQSPLVAPNTSLEYAIIDVDSVYAEDGEIIEGSYNFNDMSPVTDDGVYNEEGILVRRSTKKLTDAQRLKAELVVYKRAIKKLIQARRNYSATMKVTQLPSDVNVGDKIRLIYTNKIWNLDACSKYWKKILQKDDWYYITKTDYSIDMNGGETDTITVSKMLKIERETENNGY